MKLYAFHTPEIAKHAGYLKIGETHGNVETRVKQQGHEHNVKNEIVWSDVVISDRIGIDKIIHRYLKEQGFHVQRFDDTGKDTEWVKCTVGDVIKAFAVIKQRLYDEEKQREEVGKQFYLEIRNWFYWVTQENERIDGDYALRLVVRLLFCFFLREKDELVPKELLNSNILKNLKSNEEFSYYNGILRNLFFHCLNTQNGRKYENEKLLADKKSIKGWFMAIPFLNGGLFDDHDKDNVPIGNDYFFSERKIRLLTELGEKCDVYGLITILSKYKYKLTLDDLLDQAEYSETVAPEFIGKVFESLLSCIDADSKENRRKVTGSYYTPREIVDYMVNEALDAYLEQSRHRKIASGKLQTYDCSSDLLQCKILDPACGSGAFPCEAMNIIMHRIEEEKKEKENKEFSSSERYRTKLKIIRDVIYGVDIQPMAVQITLLRFFLSLIQDIIPDKRKPNYGIEPLPNLETKFVCANTLIGLQKRNGQGLLESRLVRETVKQLRETRRQHFMASHAYEKQRLREYDETLRKTLVMAMEDAFTDETTEKLAAWNPYDQFHAASFFDPMWMFGINDGFDIVIGNPPYVQIKRISWDDRRLFETLYATATGRFNLFYLFLEKSIELSKIGGLSSFIVPDRLMLNTQCANLRQMLLNDQVLLEIVTFDNSIFESAVVDSVIVMYQNCKKPYTHINTKNGTNIKNIKTTPHTKIPFEHFANSPSNQFDVSYNAEVSKIVKKINFISIRLGDIAEIKDGIIQGKVTDLLFHTEKQDEKSKRLLFGEDIKKYCISYNNNWVNYKPDELMQVEIARQGKGVRPGLWMRTPAIFEREKILSRQTADEIIAVLDKNSFYYANTLHGTTITDANYDVLYVLGIMNSKLLTWYYRTITAEGGKVFAQIKIALLRLLPIKEATTAEQRPVIALVKKILSVKEANSQADTSGLERKIDALVYALYGLTEKEIAIVENTL